MEKRSISKCCKARVSFLQGSDITKCRDLSQQCKIYHKKQKTVVFQCQNCGKSCNIIAGLVA